MNILIYLQDFTQFLHEFILRIYMFCVFTLQINDSFCMNKQAYQYVLLMAALHVFVWLISATI